MYDKLDEMAEKCIMLKVVELHEAVTSDGSKLSAGDLNLPGVNAGSNFPKELAEHLLTLNSLEDIVREVCRIQMLGPKYKRAEDSLSALIDTWNMLKKSL